jgi:hypothetical protein
VPPIGELSAARRKQERWGTLAPEAIRTCDVPLIQPLSNSDWIETLSELYQLLNWERSRHCRDLASFESAASGGDRHYADVLRRECTDPWKGYFDVDQVSRREKLRGA